jgi:hypothetical protein
MIGSTRLALGAAVWLAVVACTNDYDKFDATGESRDDAGATGGSAATGAGGGTGGAAGAAAAGGGGNGGSGGSTGGSGGSDGGTGGDSGTGGDGGAAGACSGTDQACGGVCTDVDTSSTHCGGCDRACSSTGVAVVACTGGNCTSFCQSGRANCTRPATGADDGCELDVSANDANCGGCGNDCGAQGALSSPFACVNMRCACTSAEQCRTAGGGSVTCDSAAGVCACEGSPCQPGEACTRSGGPQICSCNNGSACAQGQVCCQTPAGCKDVMNDPENCGACGRACAPGMSCSDGACS